MSAASKTIVVEDFKPVHGTSSLRGFCKVTLPLAGLVFYDVAIHVSGNSAWAIPSSKPRVDRNGSVLREAGGTKWLYSPIVGFTSKEIRDRFSTSVIAAFRQKYPGVLDNAA